eukprot:scaffold41382_cov69-Phaeocystis_antarctica.AAC.1
MGGWHQYGCHTCGRCVRGWAVGPAAACAARRRRPVSGRRTLAHPPSLASGRRRWRAEPAASRRAARSVVRNMRAAQPRTQPRSQRLASRPHSPACEARPWISALQGQLAAVR